MNILDRILVVALQHPEALALVEGDRTLSFRELAAAIRFHSAVVARAGLEAGQLVALDVADPVTHLLCSAALAGAGVGAYTVSEGNAGDARVCSLLGIRTILVDRDVGEAFARRIDIPRHRHGQQDAQEVSGPSLATVEAGELTWLVRSSSGTTGTPKIFLCTHRDADFRRQRYCDAVQIGPGDLFASCSPLRYGAARQRVFYALSQGATVCVDPLPSRWADTVRHIRQRSVTHLYSVPMHLEQFCELAARSPDAQREALAFPFLKCIETSSASVRPGLRADVERLLCRNLIVSYSVSEIGHISATSKSVAPETGVESLGRPVAGVEVEILEPRTLRPLPRGKAGLIGVRFPGRAADVRYLDADGRFVSCIQGGWFVPGDIGYWTERGNLVFRGRADDMLIFNGINVFPGEIESVLARHPAVKAAVAFGLRARIHQDIPCAAVTLHADVDAADLMAYCASHLGARGPVLLMKVQDFPRNAMGKVLRTELRARAQLMRGRADPAPLPPLGSVTAPAPSPSGTARGRGVDTAGDRETRGIVFCAASQPIYLAMAWLAALSIRRQRSDANIHLFTDMASIGLARSRLFSGVTSIAVEHRFASDWVSGKFCKLDALRASPFDRTLYLDCDAVIRTPQFWQVFDWLDGYDMAMTETRVDDSFTRRHLGIRLYNAGVIVYRGTPGVRALLAEWRETAMTHHRLIDRHDAADIEILRRVENSRVRRRLLMMDQLALARLLTPDHNPHGIRCTTLPDAFNIRVARPGVQVIIDHDRRRKKLAGEHIRQAALRAASAGWEDASALAEFVDNCLDGPHSVSPTDPG